MFFQIFPTNPSFPSFQSRLAIFLLTKPGLIELQIGMQSAAQFFDSQSIALAVGSYIFHDISRVSVLDVLVDARKI